MSDNLQCYITPKSQFPLDSAEIIGYIRHIAIYRYISLLAKGKKNLMCERKREHHPAEGRDHSHGHRHHSHHGEGGRHGRGGHHGEGGRHGGEHHGGGQRARRGELRTILLDTLKDAPRHGYEIIKAFEERTHGQYAPSPGTVYPTLQYLEELGLVRADQESERRVYHLTEAGQTELQAHREEVDAFWKHFAGSTPSSAGQQEIDFLRDELSDLDRTVWRGLRSALEKDDTETIRRVRQAVEQCQNEIRSIFTAPHHPVATE